MPRAISPAAAAAMLRGSLMIELKPTALDALDGITWDRVSCEGRRRTEIAKQGTGLAGGPVLQQRLLGIAMFRDIA